MDTQQWLETSLDLNLNPFHHVTGEVNKRELEGEAKGSLCARKEDSGMQLAEELNRLSSENKKLSEMLSLMCESYNALQGQFRDLMSKDSDHGSCEMHSRKRKVIDSEELVNNSGFINGSSVIESSSSDEYSCKVPKEIKSKISTVYIPVDSSDRTLLVKDGYQWRKYGQKVTRDNPSPRAYFKCSFAPSCPVKKKVQRSAEDPSLLVVTYEGNHNHTKPSQPHLSIGSIKPASSTLPASVSMIKSPSSNMTLDMVHPTSSGDLPKIPVSRVSIDQTPVLQQILVQQMASSLTRDPNFTAALAAAISGRIFDQTDPLENSSL